MRTGPAPGRCPTCTASRSSTTGSGDRAVLVTFDPRNGTAVLFDRTLEGRELTFELRGESLVDRETGTEWDRLAGRAVTPPLEGEWLVQLPAIISSFEAWSRFHPETTAWTREAE